MGAFDVCCCIFLCNWGTREGILALVGRQLAGWWIKLFALLLFTLEPIRYPPPNIHSLEGTSESGIMTYRPWFVFVVIFSYSGCL